VDLEQARDQRWLQDYNAGVSLLEEYEAQPVLAVRWPMHNAGGQRRVLTYHGASCGCMSVRDRGMPLEVGMPVTLEQGERRELQVDIHTGKAAGERHYDLRFREADGTAVKATVRFLIYASLSVTPDVASLQVASAATRPFEPIQIVHRHRRDRAPQGEPRFEPPAGIAVQSLRKVSAALPLEGDIQESRWELLLRLTPQESAAPTSTGLLTFQADKDAPAHRKRIPIVVPNEKGIRLVKACVFTPREPTASVLLVAQDDTPFRILAIEPPSRRWTAVPSQTLGRTQDVRFALGEHGTESWTETAIVRTDHPRSPRVEIAIRFAP
jgi:hypothetical protein